MLKLLTLNIKTFTSYVHIMHMLLAIIELLNLFNRQSHSCQ